MKRLLLILLPLLMCGAASFDGTTQGSATTANMSWETNVVSVSFWVRHNSTNVGKIILESSSNAGSVNNSFYVGAEGGTIPTNFDSFNLRGTANNIWRSTTVNPLNTWYHRVVVFNKSTTYGDLTTYVNGVVDGLVRPYAFTNSSGTANFVNAPLRVGARGITSVRFAGQVQDLAIFAGEVSAAEAYMLGAQRMSPLKVRSAKLINYWPFSAGENAGNSPDLVGGIPINSGTKSIVQEQSPTFRK